MDIPFKFINGLAEYNTKEVFFARLDPSIKSIEYFFNSLSCVLWFPGYFGSNWNAVYDCLRDFSWIPNRKIVLTHDVLPKISWEDLKIYLEVLKESVESWKEDDDHEFEVVFQKKDREKIESLLEN